MKVLQFLIQYFYYYQTLPKLINKQSKTPKTKGDFILYQKKQH